MKNRCAALACVSLSLALLVGMVLPAGADETKRTAATQTIPASLEKSYAAYLEAHKDVARPDKTVVWEAADSICPAHDLPSVKAAQGGKLTIPLTVQTEGLYAMEIIYETLDGSGSYVQVSLSIDGYVPFAEAGSLMFNRRYVDDGPFTEDNQGNQLPPYQVEEKGWQTVILNGVENYYGTYYEWFFTPGSHTLTLEALQGGLAVAQVRLLQPTFPGSHADYKAMHSEMPDRARKVYAVFEAEKAYAKSSSNLSPRAVKNDPSVSPSDPLRSQMNTIGGESWSLPGQWISWELDVPESGFYHIGFKYKQNFIRGIDVSRRLLIDGIVPFSEAENIIFRYNKKWQYTEIGADDDYAVYLEKGKRIVTLEAVIGDKGPILAGISNIAGELNSLYQKILMITGMTPDPYNDYYLHLQIPELRERFTANAVELRRLANELESRAGSEASTLYETARQLEEFVRYPGIIPENLSHFESNIRCLSNIRLWLGSQPLQLDYLVLRSEDEVRPVKISAGFFESLFYRTKAFIQSFTEDYSLGNRYADNQDPLDIWLSVNDILVTGVSSGRDQAVAIKRLIDDDFYKAKGIPVHLNLVNSSESILMAVVGGKAPDVVLFFPKSMHINLAIRGALEDISGSPYINDWKNRVRPSAFIPYQYEGGIYGMPEMQTYNLLFYRRDVLAALDVEVPDTWDDLYNAAARIQGRNMEVGIPPDITTLYTLLLQRGSHLYSDDLTEARMTSPEFIEAFTQWTDFYTTQGVSLAYDFFNRFRSGQMPLAIGAMPLYNQLSAAAPEISGLWGIAPLPGLVKEDGTVDRSTPCMTTASVILADSDQKSQAYSFVDWWTSADIQRRFGAVVESMMGVSSRYYTANIDAGEALNWTHEERTVLDNMQAYVTDIPQTIAAYYPERTFLNAFRKVTYYAENPREVLVRYNKELNDELTRKRQEFSR